MNMELSRLKLHKFGSHDIIHRYYIYDMIHLITQHSYDHHQAVILAATHGYLDLLEFIHKEATIINFPLASYSIRDPDIITQALNRASVYGHYHIMKWFADVSIVDNWLMPRKIYDKELDNCDINHLADNAIIYACRTGNLSMLQILQKRDTQLLCKNVLSEAFCYGHIGIYWILDQVELNYAYPIILELPLDRDPNRKMIRTLINWFEKIALNFHPQLNYISIRATTLSYQQVFSLIGSSC